MRGSWQVGDLQATIRCCLLVTEISVVSLSPLDTMSCVSPYWRECSTPLARVVRELLLKIGGLLRRWRPALDILESMEAEGPEPDVFTYSSVMDG